MSTLGFWIAFTIGVLVGRFLLTKELGNRVKGKFRKNKNYYNNNDQQQSRYQQDEICPLCKDSEFVIETATGKQIPCPLCTERKNKK